MRKKDKPLREKIADLYEEFLAEIDKYINEKYTNHHRSDVKDDFEGFMFWLKNDYLDINF